MKQERAFSILPELTHSATSAEVIPNAYAVPIESIPIFPMLDQLSLSLPERQIKIKEHAEGSSLWGELTSLKNIPNFAQRFTRLSGSIILSEITTDEPYKTFYKDRYYAPHKTTRGPSYYVAADPALDNESKAIILQNDIQAGLEVMDKIDREAIGIDELLPYLGVVDYVKNGFLNAYHALTYQERFGIKRKDREYLSHKSKLEKLAVDFTRKFYQASIGQEFDSIINIEEILAYTTEAIDFLGREVTDPSHYKLPEIDHPLSLMLNAYENTQKHSSIDTIIGLPNGGTLPAIATQLAFEYVHGEKPELIFVPFAIHSVKEPLDDTQLHEHLDAYDLSGKNILIAEDTSNTGVTLQRMHKVLNEVNAADIHVSICEIDPIRIMIKQALWDNPPATVANLLHPDFDTAVDVTPVSRGGKSIAPDKHMRKWEALNILADHYRQQTPIIPESNQQTETIPETPIPIKAENVHNIVDLDIVTRQGIKSISIDTTCTDIAAYKASLIEKNVPLAVLELQRAQEMYVFKTLPIPWAEYKGIKDMLQEIQRRDDDITTFFSMKPKSADEVSDLLSVLLPENFTKPLGIQIESGYDKELINAIKDKLKHEGFDSIQILQTIRSSDHTARNQLIEINKDHNIDSVQFDINQETTETEHSFSEIVSLMELTQKNVFIGESKNTPQEELLQGLHRQGVSINGITLASIEIPKEQQRIGLYKDKLGRLVIVRKDEEKIKNSINRL